MADEPSGSPELTKPGCDPGELRARVCRKILSEDARWAMDVILSASNVDHLSAYVPLIVGQHFIRIAHEGMIAIRSEDPRVGVPALASLLEDKYAAVTARSRHLTKLLDNTKKSFGEVLSDLASEMELHHQVMTGSSIPAVEPDLGLYYFDHSTIGATIPIAYRLGLNPASRSLISGEDLQAVSEEWGGTLAVLGAADFDASAPTPTLDLSDIRIDYHDRPASEYLPSWFDSQFPPELKILLLLIEGDLTTSRLFLPRTSPGHEGAVFRAQVVTAYHCLSALQKICDTYTHQDTRGLRSLRSFLSEEPAQDLLSSGGNKVRNRSVHYEIKDPAIVPDLAKPMYGLVEAVYPGHTWERFDTNIHEVTNRAAEILTDWKF
jgi:hypothetical protein